MIVKNLDYLEVVSEAEKVEGGLSFTQFTANTLVLGFNNSQQAGAFESLNTSAPGNNIAGFKFAYQGQAD